MIQKFQVCGILPFEALTFVPAGPAHDHKTREEYREEISMYLIYSSRVIKSRLRLKTDYADMKSTVA